MTETNPESVKIWPRTGMSYKSKFYGPGSSFEVHDASSIGIIGAQPSPERYVRMDLVVGSGTLHQISDGGRWHFEISAGDADEHVAEFNAAVAPSEAKPDKPKKGKKAAE